MNKYLYNLKHNNKSFLQILDLKNYVQNIKKFLPGGAIPVVPSIDEEEEEDPEIALINLDAWKAKAAEWGYTPEKAEKLIARNQDQLASKGPAAVAHTPTETSQKGPAFSDSGQKGGLGLSGGDWANMGIQAMNAVDQAFMGDKNFGALSEAIDNAVHGASQAMMKSGNPYLMAGAAALEGANFLTKAGGQTVQGFDVDIASSGYGDLGHKESSSSRDFGAAIGLGGLNAAKMNRKLARRNQEALMALQAANIADNQKLEQEARANSVSDIVRQNEIALAGGIDSSLLAN